jgi:hypothetical protein
MRGAQCSSMKTVLWYSAILLLLGAPSAQAQEASGRVREVYFEAARGVLVDRSMLRRPDAPRWAEVELDVETPAKRRRVMAQLPGDLQAGAGSRVTVQLAETRITGLAGELPVLAKGRVTGLLPPSQVASPLPLAADPNPRN